MMQLEKFEKQNSYEAANRGAGKSREVTAKAKDNAHALFFILT
jgi:hypothetical protein